MIVLLGAGGPADLSPVTCNSSRTPKQCLIENCPCRRSSAPEKPRRRRLRLYRAGDRIAAHQSGNPRSQQAVPTAPRLRRCLDLCLHRRRDGRPSLRAGEDRAGVHCAGQIQAGRPHLCVVGPRPEQASGRRAVQADERHRYPARRLQGIDRRPQRSHGRPRQHDVRRSSFVRAKCDCWTASGVGRHREKALQRLATCRRCPRPACRHEHTGCSALWCSERPRQSSTSSTPR